MDLRDFRQAKSFFELALAEGYHPSMYPKQICDLELADYNIDSIELTNGSLYEMAEESAEKSLLAIINPNPDWDTLDDLSKKAHLHYNRALYDQDQFENYLNGIENPSTKAEVLMEELNILLKKDDMETATKYLDLLMNLDSNTEYLADEIRLQEMRLVAKIGDIERLEILLSETVWLPFDQRWYYQALIKQKQSGGESNQNLDPYFELISTMNSYNEDAVIWAAIYFHGDEIKEMKSYNILVEALLQNPFSVNLLKAYIIESIQVGLNSYADRALLELASLTDPEDFKNFSSKANSLRVESDSQ